MNYNILKQGYSVSAVQLIMAELTEGLQAVLSNPVMLMVTEVTRS